MEKKEILDQSGITFKGLFVVFKKIWFWLLALIIVCGAGFTLLDSYQNRYRKYTYYSTATLRYAGNLKNDLETLNEYLYDPLLREDVMSQKIQKMADKNGVDRDYKYATEHYNENGEFKYNVYGGSFYISYRSEVRFTITFSSYSMREEEIKATLDQICYSLQNILGATYLPGDGESGSSSGADSKLYGKVQIQDNAGALSVVEYNNPKAPLVGVVMGILLSIAIVLLVYKLDDTVKSKEELESLTGVMFITYIEDIEESKGGSK